MKRILSNTRFYFKRIFRITFLSKKQEDIVWKDLKKLHEENEWRYGCYETDRYVETSFEIENQQVVPFFYIVSDGCFQCRVKILESFSIDDTTNIFILASHFNNILRRGKVLINVDAGFVEYQQKIDVILPFIYTGELYAEILRHHRTAKDAYRAFQRLINENEEPAIIIADLLRDNDAAKNE